MSDTELYPFPKPMAGEALLTLGVALYIALTGYERLVPEALAGKLTALESWLNAVAERVRFHADNERFPD